MRLKKQPARQASKTTPHADVTVELPIDQNTADNTAAQKAHVPKT